MRAALPRSEAERTLDQLGQRARLGVAVSVAALVVIVRQTGGAPEELLRQGFVIGAAFFVAVLAHELPARASARSLSLAAGVIADLAAASVGVALLSDEFPLAPVGLLWPIFTAGLVASTLYILGVASVATIVLFAIVLSHGPAMGDVVVASGWGLLYFGAAWAYAEVLRQFRRAQRTTETAYLQAANLGFCTTAEDVGETLFAFVDVMLGTDGTPAVLLHDERGGGIHLPAAVRGIGPESRARMRLVEGSASDVLSIVQDGGMWADPRRLSERLTLAGPLAEASRVFVVPLRDRGRVAGVVLVAAGHERALSEEAQRGIARVATQAAAELGRLRGTRLVEQQRAAMSFLLDVRRAGDDVSAIAAWTVRAARDLTGARGAALVARERGVYRALAALEADPVEMVTDAHAILETVFARRLPVVVADLGEDRRFALGASLRAGSIVGIPLHGAAAALLVRDDRGGAISSAQIELLIMLADQAALLLARARSLGRSASEEGDARAGRVGDIAERLAGPNAEVEARVVEALRLAVEGNQPHLAGSGDRVGGLAAHIAERLGLPREERDAIYVAAVLRDVGQLGLDRSIFERPRALQPAELAIVHQHPELGHAIVSSLGFLRPAADIVRAHHERYDGTGYPKGLRAGDIPIGARVLAVADAYHAMTSERPHRLAFLPADAVRAVIETAGHAFDPDVVDAFAAVVRAPRVELGPHPD